MKLVMRGFGASRWGNTAPAPTRQASTWASLIRDIALSTTSSLEPHGSSPKVGAEVRPPQDTLLAADSDKPLGGLPNIHLFAR